MIYKLIGSGDLENIVETILRNRGIEDPDSYLMLDESCCNKYSDLLHIDNAVKCFDEHFSQNDKISILIDCDCDGFTSAASMYQYIKDLDEDYPVEYIMHYMHKAHGLAKMDEGDFEIPEDTKLLIIPDAGTNDNIQCNNVIKSGVDIIILDHHEMEEEGRDNQAIIVNNQISDNYTDKDFSGVGIVYEFLRALDDYYMCDYADKYLDLVAFGNISDDMSVKNYQTRYYINQGLKDVHNRFLLALFRNQNVSDINIHNITWNITPIVNAMIRLGTYEDRCDMFEAFVEEYREFPYEKRGSRVVTMEDIYTRMARLCKNIKSKQDRLRDKVYTELLELVNLDNKVPIIVVQNADSGIIGLSCVKLANAIHRPCIVLKDMNNGMLGGSARNCSNSPIPMFKDLNNSIGVFDLCAGHQGAHGIQLQANKLEEAQEKLNLAAENVEYDPTIYCDFIIPMEYLTPEIIGVIHGSQWLYGKGIDEPKVAIESVKLRHEQSKLMGKEQDSVSFYCNGIRYCKFKCPPDDELLRLVSDGFDGVKTMNIIGECSINEYNGNVEPQVIIREYEIV